MNSPYEPTAAEEYADEAWKILRDTLRGMGAMPASQFGGTVCSVTDEEDF